jgi:ADP-ribose pyrophosphatase YjhB (NUDIX family)
LHREVREESGLQVEEAELIAIYSEPRFHFTNSYGGEHQMLAFVFLVTKWHGSLQKKLMRRWLRSFSRSTLYRQTDRHFMMKHWKI